MPTYHLNTTSRAAAEQLDRLRQLHAKIEDSSILNPGVAQDNTLVLVQKDRQQTPHPLTPY
ncbi:hypothetical protein QVA66_09045 [Staphylococcus chromogenes]|nr:hypothetical protein [Staphylococcus chromogenes]